MNVKYAGKRIAYALALVAVWAAITVGAAETQDGLETGFRSPPLESRVQAYWWWLNGNVTKEAITRDLEEMKAKGFGGAIIMDAGGADGCGGLQVPPGPVFAGPEWRELFRHALKEGARLNLEMGLNIQSGWDLGGPSVKAEDGIKIIKWNDTVVTGGQHVALALPAPVRQGNLLKEIAVVAVPYTENATQPEITATSVNKDQPWKNFPKPLGDWGKKTLMTRVNGANSNVARELEALPGTTEVAATDPAKVIDVTRFVDAKGTLNWDPPAGQWRIYRFGFVSTGRGPNTASQTWKGRVIDPLDGGAFQRYWDSTIEPLMEDVKQVGHGSLKYVHTDSWEMAPFNWTDTLPEEFKKRCGYDLTPWLPAIAGQVVGSVEASERFLHDYRKTVAALAADNHYGTFLKNAHRNGILLRAESGGPHGCAIDAQHCLGIMDVPMSEFWAASWFHRGIAEGGRFFVKQPASAAHTYGKRIVAAEGFTTVGPHWQETVWDNLKPSFDHAICEGLNQLVWCSFCCSPKEQGLPGQDLFAGTHLNPQVTWWRQSEGFLSYLNRCQFMARQGLFVADVLYYYGDFAPNFAGLKSSNPAKLPPGYDYDVATEHVILERASVTDGRITLPDGMSYTALVLPPYPRISLPVLRKLDELAKAGGTIIGPRPTSSSGLKAWQAGDTEARERIARLWGSEGNPGLIRYTAAADWLKEANLPADVSTAQKAPLDWIHRRDGQTELYFVANRSGKPLSLPVIFRVAGKAPELWDPVTGVMRSLPEFRATEDGRTEVPLELEAFGSAFVVFRGRSQESEVRSQNGRKNFLEMKPLVELTGAWQVQFDPAWFYGKNSEVGSQNSGAEKTKVVFEKLEDWTKRPEEAVRHYSGAAVYRKSFDCPLRTAHCPLSLSLGEVKEMARVELNGRDLGVVWCPPWTVEIPAGLLKEKGNQLEIEVVNFWPNRLIGDGKLPMEQRRTKTNINAFYEPKALGQNPRHHPGVLCERLMGAMPRECGEIVHYSTLHPSGLLGPVRVLAAE